jgi:histidinol-phosphate/aromatic aminotransferase/cobyric acid decarboxylase-like protein
MRALRLDAEDSQANFIWLRAPGLSGDELANRLRHQGVIVAPGGPLGADDHIRATIRDGAATARLLRALENALGG